MSDITFIVLVSYVIGSVSGYYLTRRHVASGAAAHATDRCIMRLAEKGYIRALPKPEGGFKIKKIR